MDGFFLVEKAKTELGHFCFAYDKELNIYNNQIKDLASKIKELKKRKSKMMDNVTGRDDAFRKEYMLIRSMTLPKEVKGKDDYAYDQKGNCFYLMTSADSNCCNDQKYKKVIEKEVEKEDNEVAVINVTKKEKRKRRVRVRK